MLNLTPLFKIYANRRLKKLGGLDPKEIQKTQLLSAIKRSQNTQFGRDHNFKQIRSVSDYQKAVPLRYYEDFWKKYWEPHYPKIENSTWPDPFKLYSVSSGTSAGATKYIPFTPELMASNTKAGLDTLVHHLNHKPNSKVFGGLSFVLGGSSDLKEEANGIWSGDLSGITVNELPWWIRSRYFPSKELALLSDWEEKMDILSKECLQRDIRTLSGVPSWMLIFFDKLAELRPDLPRKISSYFPNLELIIHGGVNFAPYYDQFVELLEGSNAELREVYPASEGFIAVADREYGDGLRLMIDNQLFYEFVPVNELSNENPTRHWIGNIEKDVNYAVVLTNCGGIWSYILGDTVRFVDLDPPRLLITGRTSYSLSAFGEHLIAEEVEDAVSSALHELQLKATDYSVGAVFPEKQGDLGGHLYFIEVHNDAPVSAQEIEKLSTLIDKRLCERNEDYEAHRAEGFGLLAPEIQIVPPGFFASWMKSRGKLGGQHKVPRLVSKTELFDNLREFWKNYS